MMVAVYEEKLVSALFASFSCDKTKIWLSVCSQLTIERSTIDREGGDQNIRS